LNLISQQQARRRHSVVQTGDRSNRTPAVMVGRMLFPLAILVAVSVTLPASSQVPTAMGTNVLQVVVRGPDRAGSGKNDVQVIVREADKSPKPKEIVEIVVGIATITTLGYGLYTAIRKFGWMREECTFLRIELDAKVIRRVGGLLLVAVTIRLENKGQTRLSARKAADLPYDDEFDVCDFPGTLKARPFPEQDRIKAFDWYSLQPMPGVDSALERLNYLDEFQDPRSEFEESDFWLEPNESSESQVPIWLKPGGYAFKAFFLGREIEPGEEEYWSVTKFFYLEEPKGTQEMNR